MWDNLIRACQCHRRSPSVASFGGFWFSSDDGFNAYEEPQTVTTDAAAAAAGSGSADNYRCAG
jgi:hypothetical protein